MQQDDLFDLSKPISGESYFSPIVGELIKVEDYSPFDKSRVWYLNHLFWKHFGLWQQTYQEHYEASLPSGVSESHKSSFVHKTARKFFKLLCYLENEGRLPDVIRVLEEGPGTGLYAQKFLDYMCEWSKEENKTFYDRIEYTLYDTSAEILEEAKNNLSEHGNRIVVATVFPGKTLFLYARHSNLWDQLPVRLFSDNEGVISEIQVATALDGRLEAHLEKTKSKYKLTDIATALKERRLEAIILDEPKLWKPIIKAVKLEASPVLLTEDELSNIPHADVFLELATQHHNQEFVYSDAVLNNIERLIKCTDWAHDGYIEIVDIIAPNADAFNKPRRPVKYDGSLGTVVNGLMIKAYAYSVGKHLELEQIKGLNYVATVRDHSLRALLAGDRPALIAEVAAATKQTANHIIDHTKALYDQGVDIVSFSDQAFVKSEYLTLKDVADSGVFQKLPGNALLPILKARTKTLEDIEKITKSLKQQKVGNIFVVTGDPSGDILDTGLTSLDVIPCVKADFYVGSVAHPQAEDINKMQSKIEAGANFFIMQASYDQKEWQEWADAIKLQNLHKRLPIIATIVPITSPRVLAVLEGAKDISLSTDVAASFTDVDDDAFREQGLALAKNMAQKYIESGIFSGIYLYSRSPKVVKEMADYIKTIT